MNENVDRAPNTLHAASYSSYVILLIEVANRRVYGSRVRTKLFAEGFQSRHLATENVKLHARGGELPGERAPDAARGSRDDGAFALQGEAHDVTTR